MEHKDLFPCSQDLSGNLIQLTPSTVFLPRSTLILFTHYAPSAELSCPFPPYVCAFSLRPCVLRTRQCHPDLVI
jgi:hypothetical protein